MLHCDIMKKRMYYLCLAVILTVMVFALGIGMTTGNPFVPAAIVVFTIAAIHLCHSRVTDVMTDDMASAISGRAALSALEATVIISAIGFAIAMGFYFNSGFGNGMHGFENGSVLIGSTQFYPHGQPIYDNSLLIADPAHLSMDDIVALDRMSADSHRVREFPLAFGVALGCTAVLLAGFFAAFSYYYAGKYEE